VARELPGTSEEIARVVDVGGWRASLVAEPLHELLRGEIALTIAGSARGTPRVERVKTQSNGLVR